MLRPGDQCKPYLADKNVKWNVFWKLGNKKEQTTDPCNHIQKSYKRYVVQKKPELVSNVQLMYTKF